MLNFPVKLKFSKLGKLELKVPWSKLSSLPIEILLENVLVLVSPLEKNKWDF